MAAAARQNNSSINVAGGGVYDVAKVCYSESTKQLIKGRDNEEYNVYVVDVQYEHSAKHIVRVNLAPVAGKLVHPFAL